MSNDDELYDWENGCKWEVKYYGECAVFHNLDDDFHIAFKTPEGKEITIDVIPPEAMQELYEAIGKALEERAEEVEAHHEAEQAELQAKRERAEMADEE